MGRSTGSSVSTVHENLTFTHTAVNVNLEMTLRLGDLPRKKCIFKRSTSMFSPIC